MPPSRACKQCRSAKARCDLATPVCARCTTRGLTCSGAAQSSLLFLNENATAQRNSWLARRPRRDSRLQSSTSGSQSPQKPVEMAGEDLQELYYWLRDAAMAELGQPLRRDVETRAVERFFLDWTLNPSNDGLTPGYLTDLPTLFATASPGSVLWNAVRAVAFADLREYDGGAFAVKARQSYGAALTRMRVLAADDRKLARDRILAALLLIDIFELVYLSRREPLGAHKDALRHILLLRGEGQFQERMPFELWRAAQQRLQARRILQREDPSEEQLGWIAKLNASLPDLHVCVDVEKMVVLCSAARRVMEDVGGGRSVDTAERAEELLQTMREVVVSMEAWAAQLAAQWRPRRDETKGTKGEEEAESRHPSKITFAPPFAHLPALHYSDPWLAYKWNFHAASQIMLRQSMVELTEHLHTSLSPAEERDDYADEIVSLQEATRRLAGTILESCIPLLGFSKHGEAQPRGKMARRFFAVCAMWVVQQARLASEAQRQTAGEVLEWIDRAHRLG